MNHAAEILAFQQPVPVEDAPVTCLREVYAWEVAEILLQLFDDADNAVDVVEEKLRAALQRNDHSPAFWREVLTYLIQVRG